MGEVLELNTVDNIINSIYIIRGQQVMLDSDLAKIYGYEVKRLNEQVKRNIKRFPEDFMFQLTREEIDFVKSQLRLHGLRLCLKDKKVVEENYHMFSQSREFIC